MALRLATMLVALALSLGAPAAALAQGAGDEQYSDPFGSGQNDDSGSGNEDSGAEPEPSEDQLPYTGADEGLVALAGGMLLASGLALRRRTS